MALGELLRKAQVERDADFLRESVRGLSQALMDLEVTQHVGAERYERTVERTGQRNGSRERTWDTRVAYGCPGYALVASSRRCWIRGSARSAPWSPSCRRPTGRASRLGALTTSCKPWGCKGSARGQVSRRCQDLDAEVEPFRTRRLVGPSPYVWLDVTCGKVREQGRVVSQAVVLATGVKASGEREVLGLDVGPSEDGAFWVQFLRGLVARGLAGVQWVINDAHEGLKDALRAVLQGASWQRCRVHVMCNVLAYVPRAAAQWSRPRSARCSPSRMQSAPMSSGAA